MGVWEAFAAFTAMVLGLMASAGTAISSGITCLTNGEFLRWTWKHATLRNSFSISVLVFFIYTCGSNDDIEAFLNFFPNLYKEYFNVKSAGIMAAVCTLLFCWRFRNPEGYATAVIRIHNGWQTLVDAMHYFHSLEDGDHIDRTPKRIKKPMSGIPKAIRLVPIPERPQPVPQQPGVEEPNQRSSSGASGSGSGQGNRNASNGSAGSKGSKGKGKCKGKGKRR